MRGVQSAFGDVGKEMFDAMAGNDSEADEQYQKYRILAEMNQGDSNHAHEGPHVTHGNHG